MGLFRGFHSEDVTAAAKKQQTGRRGWVQLAVLSLAGGWVHPLASEAGDTFSTSQHISAGSSTAHVLHPCADLQFGRFTSILWFPAPLSHQLLGKR